MQQLINIFKVLSDETRLRLLMLLYQEDLCVCQIAGILEVPQPRVSKNLSKLRDLNLVEDQREDKFVRYALKKNNALLCTTLESILQQLDSYPKLKNDHDRLTMGTYYLKQCQS